MSDVYFSSVGQQSSINSKDFQVSTGNSNYSSCWYPRASTPWSQPLQNELLAFFQNVSYPFRHVFEIPFRDPLRSEIRRFFLSLDAYIESPNPVIPFRDILYGSTFKDYSETLKRIKRKSFETTWKVEHFALPEWWNEVPAYTIKDIGDIFNYSYLIFWEDDTDDYLWGNVEMSGNFSMLSHFKECVRDLLPERSSFDKIDQIEITSTISSSSAYDEKLKKTQPHYKIKNRYLHFQRREVSVKEAESISVLTTVEILF
jgi:hypothetical protein